LALCNTNVCPCPLSKKADYFWSAPLGGKMPILASQRGHVRRSAIGLDFSWFVIFALLTWMLAGSYYPAEFKD
jgi:hypothetical protein